MLKIGYLFSGEGSQFKDMGLDLYQQESAYREIVDQASEVLKLDFTKSDVLNDPNNGQLAIVIMSLGIFNILNSEDLGPYKMLGLSLGEYSALIASKSINFSEGLQVVRDRAIYLKEASAKNPGKMLAILNATTDQIEKALLKARKIGQTYIANYNTPKQVVAAGENLGVDALKDELTDMGVKRLVPLNVEVASHTPMMREASEKLSKRIKNVDFSDPYVPIFSNTTQDLFTGTNIKDTLIRQLVEPTYFSHCLEKLTREPIDYLIELGPGKALAGFAKKSLFRNDIKSMNINNCDSLNRVRMEVRGSY